MTDLNSVIMIGNLTRDAELKYFQNGTAIASVAIAVNSSRKQQDGSFADEVSFFDVNIYGKTAENLKQYLVKGKKVAVVGRLKQERWQDSQSGQNRSKVVVNADSVQMLGGKEENGSSFNPATPYPTAEAARNADAGQPQFQGFQPPKPPVFQQPAFNTQPPAGFQQNNFGFDNPVSGTPTF